MTTQFTYLNKKYTVNIDPNEWYNSPDKLIVKLPNGTLLKATGWKESIPPKPNLDFAGYVVEAKEYDVEEEAYQILLKEYNLTDNTTTRKLWYKCYEHGHHSGLEEQINWFHNLVDLIIEN